VAGNGSVRERCVKNIIFPVVAAVGAMAASGAVAATAGGTVINGSFEIGVDPGKSVLLSTGDSTSIPGWTVTAGNVDFAGTAFQAADGFHTVDLSGTGPGEISQTLTGLTFGTPYRITFDLSGSYTGARTPPNMMPVGVTGNPTQVYSYDLNNTVDNMVYTPSSYSFLAQGTSATLAFNGLDAGNYGAVIDNVAIAPVVSGIGGTVPEPAMWALMLTGFGVTGAALRRRSAALAV
jgi:choice-of-anchor C domain-containing protein